MTTREEELEDFKRQIDLVSFALAQGFEIDKRRSCRTSVSMKHPGGDRIIVAKDTRGAYLFSSCHDDAKGSIIDFVTWRSGVSLGFVRKELRPWLKSHAGLAAGSDRIARRGFGPVSSRLTPPTLDLEGVKRAYDATLAVAVENPYLTVRRGIPLEVYTHPIFRDRIRIDRLGNLIFPHWQAAGELCGFEIKNYQFTGFAKGGRKGLAASRPGKDDTRLVICETFIDLLSYAAIHGVEGARFVSTAGKLNPYQPALLRSAMSKLPDGGKIIAAVDADEGGDAMEAEIRSIFDALGRPTVRFMRHSPATPGQDWNDVLKALPHSTDTPTREFG